MADSFDPLKNKSSHGLNGTFDLFFIQKKKKYHILYLINRTIRTK